jgi:hypothetical protein
LRPGNLFCQYKIITGDVGLCVMRAMFEFGLKRLLASFANLTMVEE